MGEIPNLRSKIFNVWSSLAFDLTRGGNLSEISIEGILLQLERENHTGLLNLDSSERQMTLRFNQGKIASLKGKIHGTSTESIRPLGGDRWTAAELLQNLLGWRSGTFMFLPHSKSKPKKASEISCMKLLEWGWLLLMEPQDGFLETKTILENCFGSEEELKQNQFFGEIFLVRAEAKSGEIQVNSTQGMHSIIFSNGNIQGVIAETEGSLIADLAPRYGLIRKEALDKLVEGKKTSKESLTDLALGRQIIDEETLGILKTLRIWDQVFETCHWPSLSVSWKESVKLPSSGGMLLEGARCRFCGIEVDEGRNVCETCLSKSFVFSTPEEIQSRQLRNQKIFQVGFFAILFVSLISGWYLVDLAGFFRKMSLVEYLQKEGGIHVDRNIPPPEEQKIEFLKLTELIDAPELSTQLIDHGNPAPSSIQEKNSSTEDPTPPLFKRADVVLLKHFPERRFIIQVIDKNRVIEVAVFWRKKNGQYAGFPLESWGDNLWGSEVPEEFDGWESKLFFRARNVYDRVNQSPAFSDWEVITLKQ